MIDLKLALAVAAVALVACGGDSDSSGGTTDPIASLEVGDCLAVFDFLPDDPLAGESIRPTPCSAPQAFYAVAAIVDNPADCPPGTDASLTRSETALGGPLAGGTRAVDTICVEEVSP